ncbi:MAG: FAD-dependent oxidoreductase [Lutibacter sp.]|uniref:NAD(P)/FAD-dependent oxidoreductase n=1 Tax=Lutibacter sp. TaxID=1925666 RepID=UPI0019FA0EC4|nr:FAD-dependent oxidoreductase [Lutibacter sp.]NOR28449.1 FAD-dependent oxidoreductase [Lutibacter sp.]
MSKKVVIIGGGIIGLSTAYFLLKEGHDVTVIDQSNISSGASFVNAGFISPSHIIPLAAPGVVSTGIKMMFNSASPFYIKPRFNVDLFKWLWKFNKSATEKNVEYASSIIKDLNYFSLQLFQEMKENNVFDFHIEKKGLLMAYQTSKFEDKEGCLAEFSKRKGLLVKHINKEKLKEMEPEIAAKGAFYYLDDAHTTPDDFMRGMQKYLETQGVTFLVNEKVIDFEQSSSRITHVVTNKNEVSCDEFVVAAGSWSPLIAKKLGVKLLVQAGKGYRINLHRETGINYPTILAELNTAVSPMDGFTRFGGTMEIAGINSGINKIRVQKIAKNAKMFYPNISITENEMSNVACGLRPISPDGLPFIGRSKKLKNAYFATGHGMMGWSQGHATGKLISELISDKKTSLNLTPFSIDRFN